MSFAVKIVIIYLMPFIPLVQKLKTLNVLNVNKKILKGYSLLSLYLQKEVMENLYQLLQKANVVPVQGEVVPLVRENK